MKNKIFLFFSILIFSSNVFSADISKLTETEAINNNIYPTKTSKEIKKLDKFCSDDVVIFLDYLKQDRVEYKEEFLNSVQSMNLLLNGVQGLIEEGRKEIKLISYVENRNLLITSIFLWISITIFIIMNLVFANNLKKELYFLRNGLLRSEIKDNMIALSDQLKTINEKLAEFNKNNNI